MHILQPQWQSLKVPISTADLYPDAGPEPDLLTGPGFTKIQRERLVCVLAKRLSAAIRLATEPATVKPPSTHAWLYTL